MQDTSTIDNKNILEYRFERKFLVTELSKYEIEASLKLHPAFFSEIYYERFINNIYFDTHNMKSLMDNIAGLHDRMKIRVRWYGSLFGKIDKPVLEFKIKKGWYGRKESYKLASFDFNSGFCIKYFEKILEKSDLPSNLLNYLKCLSPTLVNRYQRKYFESADHKYRVTIDSNLKYYSINRQINQFLSASSDHSTTVVELKYNTQDDDKASDISTLFPFRMTKSSKYVTGVEKTDFW